MCTTGCLDFTRDNLRESDVRGKTVLEVGSRDHNGTVRSIIEASRPRKYVGVDMLAGPGVDVVCDAGDLVSRFGGEAFDLVVATELLEHARDWRAVVTNLKNVLRPGALLLLTTRSQGFPFHPCPGDFWRYQVEDFERIFADLTIELLQEDDRRTPGVFLCARKPISFFEVGLDDVRLYSVLTRRRASEAGPVAVASMKLAARGRKVARSVLPKAVTDLVIRRMWRTLDQPIR
jgi:SAM-dependent methyltransferase